MYIKLSCKGPCTGGCKVNKDWPFLVSLCPHGKELVNKAKSMTYMLTKQQEVAKMPDSLL